MSKRQEIERLIAKYQAEIAELEEREEDLLRRIQILENIVPTVLVWYMWKVSHANREPPLFDSEDEARQKLLHLESVLEDLQKADQELKQEESIMKKRIEELESSLKDEYEQIPISKIDKTSSVSTHLPEIPIIEHEIEKGDLRIKALEEKRLKYEELLQDADKEWKNMCENLIKEVDELTEKLKSSSENIKENENYILELEEDILRKEKELQAKIREMVKKTDALVSELSDKEREKYFKDELEDKEIIKSIQDSLGHVGRMKDELISFDKVAEKARVPLEEEPEFSPKSSLEGKEEQLKELSSSKVSTAKSEIVHETKSIPLVISETVTEPEALKKEPAMRDISSEELEVPLGYRDIPLEKESEIVSHVSGEVPDVPAEQMIIPKPPEEEREATLESEVTSVIQAEEPTELKLSKKESKIMTEQQEAQKTPLKEPTKSEISPVESIVHEEQSKISEAASMGSQIGEIQRKESTVSETSPEILAPDIPKGESYISEIPKIQQPVIEKEPEALTDPQPTIVEAIMPQISTEEYEASKMSPVKSEAVTPQVPTEPPPIADAHTEKRSVPDTLTADEPNLGISTVKSSVKESPLAKPSEEIPSLKEPEDSKPSRVPSVKSEVIMTALPAEGQFVRDISLEDHTISEIPTIKSSGAEEPMDKFTDLKGSSDKYEPGVPGAPSGEVPFSVPSRKQESSFSKRSGEETYAMNFPEEKISIPKMTKEEPHKDFGVESESALEIVTGKPSIIETPTPDFTETKISLKEPMKPEDTLEKPTDPKVLPRESEAGISETPSVEVPPKTQIPEQVPPLLKRESTIPDMSKEEPYRESYAGSPPASEIRSIKSSIKEIPTEEPKVLTTEPSKQQVSSEEPSQVKALPEEPSEPKPLTSEPPDQAPTFTKMSKEEPPIEEIPAEELYKDTQAESTGTSEIKTTKPSVKEIPTEEPEVLTAEPSEPKVSSEESSQVKALSEVLTEQKPVPEELPKHEPSPPKIPTEEPYREIKVQSPPDSEISRTKPSVKEISTEEPEILTTKPSKQKVSSEESSQVKALPEEPSEPKPLTLESPQQVPSFTKTSKEEPSIEQILTEEPHKDIPVEGTVTSEITTTKPSIKEIAAKESMVLPMEPSKPKESLEQPIQAGAIQDKLSEPKLSPVDQTKLEPTLTKVSKDEPSITEIPAKEPYQEIQTGSPVASEIRSIKSSFKEIPTEVPEFSTAEPSKHKVSSDEPTQVKALPEEPSEPKPLTFEPPIQAPTFTKTSKEEPSIEKIPAGEPHKDIRVEGTVTSEITISKPSIKEFTTEEPFKSKGLLTEPIKQKVSSEVPTQEKALSKEPSESKLILMEPSFQKPKHSKISHEERSIPEIPPEEPFQEIQIGGPSPPEIEASGPTVLLEEPIKQKVSLEKPTQAKVLSKEPSESKLLPMQPSKPKPSLMNISKGELSIQEIPTHEPYGEIRVGSSPVPEITKKKSSIKETLLKEPSVEAILPEELTKETVLSEEPAKEKVLSEEVPEQEVLKLVKEAFQTQPIRTDDQLDKPGVTVEGHKGEPPSEGQIIISGPPDKMTFKDLQEPGFPDKRSSEESSNCKSIKSKCRVKDHLIKSMADELRELARNNIWSSSKGFTQATSADPVKTYDFDRTTLLLYLNDQVPQNFYETMKNNENYSRENPLVVKIINRLDQESLLIEWGPPPPPEVAGFQIFINGQFQYWIHSAKRNMALLHPLDLGRMQEIAVSPVNDKGDIVYTSKIVHSPN